MRYLIVSDIHANWEALEAVLAQAQGKYERIICCGDVVGYGADPDIVTEWVRQNVEAIIRGNHDRACSGLEDLEWFNPVARVSALWTQAVTNPRNIEYLRQLAKGPERMNGFQILHGSPLDEDDYVVSERDAAQVAPYLESTLTFFGHTHIQGGFLCHRNGVKRLPRPAVYSAEETLEIEKDIAYLINPGSVGQPRDNDPRAAYAIYETNPRIITFWRTEYDVDTTQQKILKAGLPDILAKRLSNGS